MIDDELIAKLKENDIDYFWQIITDILLKISGTLYKSEKFDKLFSPYMVCRYLSMKQSLLEYAILLNQINSTASLTKEQFYKLAYSIIPKQSNSFIKYIKKKEKSKKEKEEQNIEYTQSSIKSNIFDL